MDNRSVSTRCAPTGCAAATTAKASKKSGLLIEVYTPLREQTLPGWAACRRCSSSYCRTLVDVASLEQWLPELARRDV